MKVIEKYLDTKNKKIAAGVTAAVIIAAVGGGTYWALRDTAPELLLKNSKTITVEYGEKYELKFERMGLIKKMFILCSITQKLLRI